MTVLLLNGSPHKEGTTFAALKEVQHALQQKDVQSEILHLGTKPVYGCTACRHCAKTNRCIFEDKANEIIEKMQESDAFIVGSPVYYAGANGALCAVLDRVFFAGSSVMARKPAAAVAVCRRGGAASALDRLHKYFGLYEMPIVSSTYWNMGFGRSMEDFSHDEEGIQTMRILGKNMAQLLQMQEKANLPPVEQEAKIWTSFIR